MHPVWYEKEKILMVANWYGREIQACIDHNIYAIICESIDELNAFQILPAML